MRRVSLRRSGVANRIRNLCIGPNREVGGPVGKGSLTGEMLDCTRQGKSRSHAISNVNLGLEFVSAKPAYSHSSEGILTIA